ncbi:MAG TPA: hypothetical protein PK815_05800 [Verrucomicrobiota bacterium]|jgi:hypothetical protein|nr:hypothetical protein [Verrucomicrobiota bacterium]HRR64835.1 hypothetical protein [Candidatus Paceibacterota bacterium]HNR71113.1 hypothetical protein [Verrucomicrobiota bacterium]HNS69739.1 hypothetical protein [Verrucomicrobiota bacterium]HOM46329.1 hypothetical protein [Verrucomicrobiota bacterium]
MAVGCSIGSVQTRQIGLQGCSQKAPAVSGGPIDSQQAAQFELLPRGRTHQRKEPGKAVSPLAEEGAEAQPQVDPQRRPYLPALGIGVMTREVGPLEALFEFLEEGLDAPAAAIQIGNDLGASFPIVGQ